MKRLTCFCPEETAEKLRNPERGFYSILRWQPGAGAALPETLPLHGEDTLLLVEVNLRDYASGELPAAALEELEALLTALTSPDIALILRFLYDWDGHGLAREPRELDTVLCHVRQLGPVVRAQADRIYLTQGLLVGNWGEMHGSRHLGPENLKRLYAACASAMGDRVILSLRTPAMWRSVTGLSSDGDLDEALGTISAVPALFNDGMLGSRSDFGTYGDSPEDRERELAFQNRLCRFVPNGGEVVGTAPQSEPERAMRTLRRMRVSYLNRDYDTATLARWKSARLPKGGLWGGKSYFDYAEAHLGYRFVVRSAELRQSLFSDGLTGTVLLDNVGFAPIYQEVSPELVFSGTGGERSFPMSGPPLRQLDGSKPGAYTLPMSSLSGRLMQGEYSVCFRLRSLKNGAVIRTANKGCSELGCPIGRYCAT